MTVATTTNRESFNGDDTTIEFDFTYKAFADSDIKVVIRAADDTETALVLDTDYTVVVDEEAGGTVTLIGDYAATPPATGETVVIYRELPYTQAIDPIENDPQRADVQEEGLDRAVILIQQLKDAMARSLQLPVSTAFSDLALPEPEAAKYLRWNAGGTALENIALTTTALAVSAFAETLLDDADAAAFLATLGITSSATARIFARKTAGAGAFEECTLSQILDFIGSAAAGDLLYRGASTWSRLAKGTAAQVLRMNSGASAPEWGAGVSFKVVAGTRAMDAASGDVAYTGAGFTPTLVIAVGATNAKPSSVGFAVGAAAADHGSTVSQYAAQQKLMLAWEDTGKTQDAVLKTFDADGCTLTWTRTGATASATFNFYLLFVR